MVTEFAKEMIKKMLIVVGLKTSTSFHVRIITSSICELARRGD